MDVNTLRTKKKEIRRTEIVGFSYDFCLILLEELKNMPAYKNLPKIILKDNVSSLSLLEIIVIKNIQKQLNFSIINLSSNTTTSSSEFLNLINAIEAYLSIFND